MSCGRARQADSPRLVVRAAALLDDGGGVPTSTMVADARCPKCDVVLVPGGSICPGCELHATVHHVTTWAYRRHDWRRAIFRALDDYNRRCSALRRTPLEFRVAMGMAPPERPAVPSGWRAVWSTTDREYYYWHFDSNHVQWEAPRPAQGHTELEAEATPVTAPPYRDPAGLAGSPRTMRAVSPTGWTFPSSRAWSGNALLVDQDVATTYRRPTNKPQTVACRLPAGVCATGA